MIVYPLYLTIEHLVPLSKGGNNTKENKRNCCNACNKARGNLDLEIFLIRCMRKAKRMPGHTIYMDRVPNISRLIDFVNSHKSELIKNG